MSENTPELPPPAEPVTLDPSPVTLDPEPVSSSASPVVPEFDGIPEDDAAEADDAQTDNPPVSSP